MKEIMPGYFEISQLPRVREAGDLRREATRSSPEQHTSKVDSKSFIVPIPECSCHPSSKKLFSTAKETITENYNRTQQILGITAPVHTSISQLLFSLAREASWKKGARHKQEHKEVCEIVSPRNCYIKQSKNNGIINGHVNRKRSYS